MEPSLVIAEDQTDRWIALVEQELLPGGKLHGLHEEDVSDEMAEVLPDGSLRFYVNIRGAERLEMIVPPGSWGQLTYVDAPESDSGE